jgi:hypothetical protein
MPTETKRQRGRPRKLPGEIRRVKVDLPAQDYERLRAASGRSLISIAGYARQAIMLRIQTDEHQARGLP